MVGFAVVAEELPLYLLGIVVLFYRQRYQACKTMLYSKKVDVAMAVANMQRVYTQSHKHSQFFSVHAWAWKKLSGNIHHVFVETAKLMAEVTHTLHTTPRTLHSTHTHSHTHTQSRV